MNVSRESSVDWGPHYYQIEVTIEPKQIGSKHVPPCKKTHISIRCSESTMRDPGASIISRCDDFSNKHDRYAEKIILKFLTNLSAVLIEFLKPNFNQVLRFYDYNINLLLV